MVSPIGRGAIGRVVEGLVRELSASRSSLTISSSRGVAARNGEDRNSVCPGASNGGLVIS